MKIKDLIFYSETLLHDLLLCPCCPQEVFTRFVIPFALLFLGLPTCLLSFGSGWTETSYVLRIYSCSKKSNTLLRAHNSSSELHKHVDMAIHQFDTSCKYTLLLSSGQYTTWPWQSLCISIHLKALSKHI